MTPLSPPFQFPIRVYWEDTDAGGVVYHANYLHFLERARSEWLRARGIEQQNLRVCKNMILVVRDMQVDFLKPARLDDLLQVSVQLHERRSASLIVTQELFRGAECLLRAKIRIACLMASTFRPRSLPEWLLSGEISGDKK